MSYVILFLSLLTCKIVGLELFGLLQLLYIDLSTQTFLTLYSYPLTKFGSVNGPSVQLTEEEFNLPKILSEMEIGSPSLLNNCNIVLFLVLFELVLSVTLFLLSSALKNKILRHISLCMLKEGSITLLMFSTFPIAFFTGIHWKYASSSTPLFIGSSILLYTSFFVLLVSLFLL